MLEIDWKVGEKVVKDNLKIMDKRLSREVWKKR